MSSKILARAGCGGRIFDASRPGRKVKTLKHYLPIVRKLRGRLEYATGGNAESKRER